MTIPYQHNCSHQGDGWCLECTGELGKENERLAARIVELESDYKLMSRMYDHAATREIHRPNPQPTPDVDEELHFPDPIRIPGKAVVSGEARTRPVLRIEEDQPTPDPRDARIAELEETLGLLHDHQNGCPLPKYEPEWNRAMADTERLLGLTTSSQPAPEGKTVPLEHQRVRVAVGYESVTRIVWACGIDTATNEEESTQAVLSRRPRVTHFGIMVGDVPRFPEIQATLEYQAVERANEGE